MCWVRSDSEQYLYLCVKDNRKLVSCQELEVVSVVEMNQYKIFVSIYYFSLSIWLTEVEFELRFKRYKIICISKNSFFLIIWSFLVIKKLSFLQSCLYKQKILFSGKELIFCNKSQFNPSPSYDICLYKVKGGKARMIQLSSNQRWIEILTSFAKNHSLNEKQKSLYQKSPKWKAYKLALLHQIKEREYKPVTSTI